MHFWNFFVVFFSRFQTFPILSNVAELLADNKKVDAVIFRPCKARHLCKILWYDLEKRKEPAISRSSLATRQSTLHARKRLRKEGKIAQPWLRIATCNKNYAHFTEQLLNSTYYWAWADSYPWAFSGEFALSQTDREHLERMRRMRESPENG